MDTREEIRSYIRENMLFGDNSVELPDDRSLIEEGVVDSTGVLELVLFVEQEFGVTVESEELIPENFDSIGRLADFVNRKNGIAPD